MFSTLLIQCHHQGIQEEESFLGGAFSPNGFEYFGGFLKKTKFETILNGRDDADGQGRQGH
jgi:hypothetical protein